MPPRRNLRKDAIERTTVRSDTVFAPQKRIASEERMKEERFKITAYSREAAGDDRCEGRRETLS